MKKIAVIDILLAYPPVGGAGVDLFNTFGFLQNEFQIKIFGLKFEPEYLLAPQDFARGILKEPPPLPCELIDPGKNLDRQNIVDSILEEISQWSPDLVFIADGWTLKTFIIDAVSRRFKTLVRMYAFEMLCPRNNQRWLFDHKCDNFIASETCPECLQCASEYADIVKKHRNGAHNPLTFEAEIADIQRGDYHEVLIRALKNARFIVYNSGIARIIDKYSPSPSFVIPGAVDLKHFIPSQKTLSEKFRILVPGRMNDLAKGADIAIEAAKILLTQGVNLEMTITRNQSENNKFDWLIETGWQSKTQIIELLKNTDCVLVPSLWEEPFGLVWAEAMAMKVPVVASRIAGPAEYIEDEITGLLAEPGNPADFAKKILHLYHDESLSQKLSRNGRKAVEERFNWQHTSQLLKEAINSTI
jgi:glycosyltransferase involved in cell wall biosynthesis